MDVDSLLNNTITGLRATEPVLAASLTKWRPYFCSTVRDLNEYTKRDPIDVAQDLMLSVVEANISYKADLYRYNRRLYEVDFEDGSIARLRCPKYKKSLSDPFWVNKDSLSRVKKAKYDTFLYNVLSQQYLDILSLWFTKKNGWDLKLRPGSKKMYDAEKKFSEVLSCDIGVGDGAFINDVLASDSSDPESLSVAKSFLCELLKQLSATETKILQYMLAFPGISIGELSSRCGLSKVTISLGVSSIRRVANRIHYKVRPVYFRSVSPVVLH